jgi:hypothetical protein
MRIPRPRLRFRYVARHRRPRTVRPHRRFLRITFAIAIVVAGTVLLASDGNTPAYAAAHDTVVVAAPPQTVEQVVDNVRLWLLGIIAAVATFFATVGGLRIMASNGDPGEHEKGKTALKSAAIGYLLALLAPLLVTIVGGWVK